MPDLKNNSEFWYDTVLTYCMLLNNGFRDDDIYVLYGDGHDPDFAETSQQEQQQADGSAAASPVPSYYQRGRYCSYQQGGSGGKGAAPEGIVDFPMTIVIGPSGERDIGCYQDTGEAWHCAPQVIFDCLAKGCDEPGLNFALGDPIRASQKAKIEALTASDYFFVWWKGHGGTGEEVASTPQEPGQSGTEAPVTLDLKIGGGSLDAATLTGWINTVPAARRLYVFETCKSGCLSGTLGKDTEVTRPILLSACGCDQSAWYWENQDVLHGVFTFWMAGTLGGGLPPASQNPLGVKTDVGQSVDEAFAQSRDATVDELGTAVGQTPEKSEGQPPLSPTTRLDRDTPCDQPGTG